MKKTVYFRLEYYKDTDDLSYKYRNKLSAFFYIHFAQFSISRHNSYIPLFGRPS